MRLEKGRLVGDQAVSSGVAFVKAVVGKLRHQIEDGRGFFGVVLIGGGTRDEAVLLLLHLGGDFLAHGAA